MTEGWAKAVRECGLTPWMAVIIVGRGFGRISMYRNHREPAAYYPETREDATPQG